MGKAKEKAPFERLTDFVKKVLEVPKAEVDEAAERSRRPKRRRKGHARPSP
jgi:hypothetical protein